VPVYRRVGEWMKKRWSRTRLQRWLDARNESRRSNLRQLESKVSALLAESANLTIIECLERFNSSFNGLQESQVPSLLSRYGQNVLSTAKPRRWWSILLGCLPNPFNILLTVLAIISVATQQTATFVILMAMVFLSVALRFWQEHKNVRALNELVMLIHDNVQIVRDGVRSEVPKSDIVPGDLIVLSGGEIVAADVVLVDTSGLYVSQSTLTGETLPVLKQLSSAQVEPDSIFEASNVCFAGTNVASGSATGLVVATGDSITLPGTC
jgi:P-type Mg2+ transporter